MRISCHLEIQRKVKKNGTRYYHRSFTDHLANIWSWHAKKFSVDENYKFIKKTIVRFFRSNTTGVSAPLTTITNATRTDLNTSYSEMSPLIVVANSSNNNQTMYKISYFFLDKPLIFRYTFEVSKDEPGKNYCKDFNIYFIQACPIHNHLPLIRQILERTRSPSCQTEIRITKEESP